MPSVAILIQPAAKWPVIVAIDAMPGMNVMQHWPDYPEITGVICDGVPLLTVNQQGVFAAVISMAGSAPDKRDPHELMLDLLDNPDAADAALALRDLDPNAYGMFMLAIGDNRDCYVASNWQDSLQIDTLGPGRSILGRSELILPMGLQPGDDLWEEAYQIRLALPGIDLFGTSPLWQPNLNPCIVSTGSP